MTTPSKWEAFNNRMRQEASHSVIKNNKQGLVIVTAHVLITHDGEPLVWVVNEGKRIEPSANAAQVIKSIIDVT